MVATGVGAAAGALMIAGGVMGAINMTLQEPAVPEAMKEAGINVDILNKVMMALEIAIAVIGAVVTFGGAAAGGIAKLAAKSAGKIAQKVTDIATKAAANMAKIADMGSKAATTTVKAIRYGAQTVDLTVNVGKGVTDSVHAVNNAHVTEIQADITGLRANMTLSQAVIDRQRGDF
ncbi:type III secretion system translocon subunit SctE [Photobacterium leiognathi]|uniref:type III secretion system translocon subunit SctE n=1 Tax=Photobacterium leiognathi TaxID=553611 RepID=UPI003F74BFF7